MSLPYKAAESSNASADWSSFFASLTSGNTKLGISSPLSDPAGLRGWLVLEAAGFGLVEVYNLAAGVVAVHRGVRI